MNKSFKKMKKSRTKNKEKLKKFYNGAVQFVIYQKLNSYVDFDIALHLGFGFLYISTVLRSTGRRALYSILYYYYDEL